VMSAGVCCGSKGAAPLHRQKSNGEECQSSFASLRACCIDVSSRWRHHSTTHCTNFYDMFSRFDTMSARDRRSDGRRVCSEKTALCMRDALKKRLGVVDRTSVYETTCHISRLLHNYAVVGGRIDDRLQACANPLISISMLG